MGSRDLRGRRGHSTSRIFVKLALIGALAAGGIGTAAAVDVLGALKGMATVVGNQVAQIAQRTVQAATYGDEPGNYGFFQSFLNMFSPKAADNKLTAGNNTWGAYAIPAVDAQVNRKKYFAWQKVELDKNATGAACSDGSNYKFFVNLTNASNNFLIMMEPGGGCTDYGTCTGNYPQKKPDGGWLLDASGKVAVAKGPGVFNANGINDNYMDVVGNVLSGSAMPNNGDSPKPGELLAPFLSRLSWLASERLKIQDWNVVYMPYCTGDAHLGDNKVAYSSVDGKDGKVMEHKGVRNVLGTMGWLRSNLPRPAQVFLAGQSAGSLAVDVHRLTVRQVLNPSDSLYTAADAGFLMEEDPIHNDEVNFPATNFIRAAKKSWWGYDATAPSASTVMPALVKTMATQLPGFNPANISNVSTLISQKYPNDRTLFISSQTDLNFSEYGYHKNAAYQAAAVETGDINLNDAPAHFSPMGNYLRASWKKDLDRKISSFQQLSADQGYFYPSGRRMLQSHCMTALTYEGTENADTGHNVVNALNNLIDRRRPPVFREKESNETRGLYAPLGPNTKALASVLGEEDMLFPPLHN